MTNIKNIVGAQEIQRLRQACNLQGVLSLLTTWGIIAGSMALVAWRPNILTVAVAVILIGGRQLALAILMHECSHRSLFRSRWLNDIVGKWLIAAPVWQDLGRYRTHHLQHHNNTNQPQDPDLDLVTPFPVTKASLTRKFARDLSGLSGLRRIVGLLAMDLGFTTFTASANSTRLQRPRWGQILINAWFRIGPVVLTNGVILATLWLIGQPALYWLWVAAYFTTFSLFVRIRSIAEHAMMPIVSDVLQNTRTTRASWLARVTVAPHHVNYHLEHHLLMSVPHYRLRALHRKIRSLGLFTDNNFEAGYVAVLRKAIA